ncbi:hypothetical protein [Cupriavidus sp. DF5525]|uniref:hypothetical protein n=1 Tax=Cupriavidus sp. DF5525 TaxID=3160989 RepID=UPI0032E040C4
MIKALHKRSREQLLDAYERERKAIMASMLLVIEARGLQTIYIHGATRSGVLGNYRLRLPICHPLAPARATEET